MNTPAGAQLIAIDRALLALMQERARILAARPHQRAAIDDLLGRVAGPLDVALAREVFEALDAGASS